MLETVPIDNNSIEEDPVLFKRPTPAAGPSLTGPSSVGLVQRASTFKDQDQT